MKKILQRFKRDEHGATAIEYALIAALVSITLIGAMSSLAPKIEAVFEQVGNATPQS